MVKATRPSDQEKEPPEPRRLAALNLRYENLPDAFDFVPASIKTRCM
jgi:hypothetical protein